MNKGMAMSTDTKKKKRKSVIILKLKDIALATWKAFKSKYFMNVLVVFLAGILVGGYSLTTKNATFGSSSSGVNAEMSAIYGRATGKSNAEVLENLVTQLDFLQLDTDLAPTTSQKYTHGVVSVFVNQMTSSGSVAFGILNGINTLVFKNSVPHSVVIFIFAILLLLINIFVKNILLVGKCRYFLEHRRYDDTKADKLLFIYKVGCTPNVAKVMFFRYILQILWNLTIIGGIIKKYEYAMIPYILAEDPTIGTREAFKLSKELARGEKKRMFLIDIIYMFGFALSSFTYNFLSVFFLNPMKECTYAEIYMTLRNVKSDIKTTIVPDRMLNIYNISDGVYPETSFNVQPLKKRSWIHINYDRKYSISTLILFFFTFAFVGWVWEVFYTLLNEGILANRGTLFGPWLPIYGFGGMIIIVLLRPLRKNPLIMFIGAFVACGVLEYFTAWALETLFDTKWWDYTGFFLNIHGRVCLEGLFVFGLAGVAFTYIFAPMLDNLYAHLKPSYRKPICTVLIILFAIDAGWSAFHPNTGAGITSGGSNTPADQTLQILPGSYQDQN